MAYSSHPGEINNPRAEIVKGCPGVSPVRSVSHIEPR